MARERCHICCEPKWALDRVHMNGIPTLMCRTCYRKLKWAHKATNDSLHDIMTIGDYEKVLYKTINNEADLFRGIRKR